MKKYLAIFLSLAIVLVSLSTVNDILHRFLCSSGLEYSTESSASACLSNHEGCSSKSSESSKNEDHGKGDCNSFTCPVAVFSNASLDFDSNIEIGSALIFCEPVHSLGINSFFSYNLGNSNFVRGPPLIFKV